MSNLRIVGVVPLADVRAREVLQKITPSSSPLISMTDETGGATLWVRGHDWVHRIDGRIPIVFAGRLDNRDELTRTLGLNHGLSDAALAAAAWRRWGDDALPRLLGGFILAVWDGATAELVLAVDATGEETVFTASLSGCFVFANHPDALRPYLEGQDGRADQEALAHWLWRGKLPPGRTLFCGIDRASPGTLWRIGRSGIRRQTYWRPGDAPPIRFRRDEDYVEAAREMLDRVVKPHLPTDGRLIADLTGGLDTATVTTAAARLAPHLTIDCFTTVSEAGVRIPYEVPGHSGDEWPAAQATAAAYPNLRLHRIEAGKLAPEEIDPTSIFETATTALPSVAWSGWWNSRMCALADRAPCRVLTGAAGNFTLSRDGFDRLPELLAGGRWATLAAEIHALTKKDGRSWRWYLMRHAVYPTLSAQRRRLIRRLRGHDFSFWPNINLIRPEAIARYGLTDSTEALGRLMPLEGQTNRDGLIGSITNVFSLRHTVHARYRPLGIDLRMPLFDPRMVDFCLSLPADQFLRNGVTRRLARRVLAGRVPDLVSQRPRTYLNCPEWHHRLTRARPHWMAAIERLEGSAAVNELLDMAKLRRLAESWPENPTIDQERSYSSILPGAIMAGQFIRWANREN